MRKNHCDSMGVFHNFQPRYDEFKGTPSIGIEKAGEWNSADSARYFLDGIETTVKKTYVCDVCTACGKVVKRP